MKQLFKNMLLVLGLLLGGLTPVAPLNASLYGHLSYEPMYVSGVSDTRAQASFNSGYKVPEGREGGVYQLFENNAMVKSDMELGYALPFDGINYGPGEGGTELLNDNTTGNVDTPLSFPHYFFAFMLLVYLSMLMYKRRKATRLK